MKSAVLSLRFELFGKIVKSKMFCSGLDHIELVLFSGLMLKVTSLIMYPSYSDTQAKPEREKWENV